MTTLTVTEQQLRLIQSALDFYSRVGIGQTWVIKDHPTYKRVLHTKLREDNDGVVDYEKYHDARERADILFSQGRNLLLQEEKHANGSYGIHHPNVDEWCRMAFDIVQVIRHEFWKRNPDRSEITVDSHIHFTSTEDSYKIKCNISETNS